jgi:hypothetical protein
VWSYISSIGHNIGTKRTDRTGERRRNENKNKRQKKTTTPTKEGAPVGEIVQIMTQRSVNFIITPEMLFMDEETTQRPMKYIEMLDLVFPKIPTKELYKLQVSIVQEIQSKARSDATKLQLV